MADINSYALGLELQLQINPAMKALDDLSSRIEKIQEQLGKSAGSIKIGTTIEKEADTVAVVKDQLNAVYASMAKAYTDVENAAKLFGSAIVLSDKQLELQSKAIEKATAKFRKYEQQFNHIVMANLKFKPELKKQIESYEKLGDNMDDLHQSSSLVTRKMQEQKAMIGSLISSLGVFGESANSIVQIGTALASKWGILGVVGLLYANAIREIIGMQEVYSKVSAQAIGTQEELIGMTNKLRYATKATAKEGTATFMALSAAGFHASDSIDELADSNFKFSFATGISQDATARYQRALVLLMDGSKSSTTTLGSLSAMMKTTGMSAKDASRFITNMANAALGLSLVMDKTELKDYQDTLQTMVGALTQAGSPEAAASLEGFFNRISQNVIESANEWSALTGEFNVNKKASELLKDVFKDLPNALERIGVAQGNVGAKIAQARGLTNAEAKSMELLAQQYEKAGGNLEALSAGLKKNVNLTKDFDEAMKTLTGQFKAIIEPIMAWVTEFVKAHPIITQIVIILASAAFFTGLVTSAIGGLINVVTSFTDLAAKGVSIIGKWAGRVTEMGTAAKTTNQATGSGVKAFMTEVAAGLKAFADPKTIIGLAVIGTFVVIMTGVVVGVAAAIKELGLSANDLIMAAGAMLIGVGVLGIAIGLLSLVGAEALAAAPLLWPLAAVMLALGAAILLAGFGVKLAGEAFEKLFTVVLNNAFTFLMVVGAMVIALPALSFGLGLFAVALGLSAPVILFGMGELFAAALLGLVVAPVFAKLATSFALISTAMASIGPRAGISLISLAVGMLAFMAALTGASALGTVTTFLGLTKDPLIQAKKVADAITMISSPAVSLASALLKVKNVGDAFKPIIDSVLDRKKDLDEAVAAIIRMNKELLTIDKTIKETGFTQPVAGAIPIRKPLIADDTARRVNEQRGQTQIIDNTKSMKASIDKIGDKLSSNNNMKDLIELLRVWLPKIAQPDTDEGLGSTVNQWM